jgi:hypothetical protein
MDHKTEDETVLTEDSVTHLDGRHRGRVVIAGSHGGVYAAYLAAKAELRGVILNDAGGGLDGSGHAGLDYLDALGIPAATVGAMSARIGDGADMTARGIVNRVNGTAAALGCAPGQGAPDCARRMTAAAWTRPAAPPLDEARHLLLARPGEPEVWALDSASLVGPDDVGRILVIGSHGGAPGGLAKNALKANALAAVFHDAGVGADQAGLSRLALLDTRGVAAAVVDGNTARIGDGRSLWATGRISFVNRTAEALGATPGLSVPAFVDRVIARTVAGGK